MKFLLPNKSNLLGVFYIIVFVVASYILFLFLGGDPFNGDRGHESYSGTRISEVYIDILNWIFPYSLYLPASLFSLTNHEYNLKVFFYLALVTLIYWYIVSCVYNYFNKHILNKFSSFRKRIDSLNNK